MIFALIVIGWVCCGVLSYGALMAFQWHEFVRLRSGRMWRRDAGMSLFIALTGPIGLIVTVTTTGFCADGFMYRRPKEIR